MYYAFVENNILTGAMQDVTKDDALNLEITEQQYNNIQTYGINYYKYENGNIILNPNYNQEQAEKREQDFLKVFFKVEPYGYYRRIPKGYQSAVDSMNTAFNSCVVAGGLPANTIIFYPEPDFTIAEQCTEEWLVEHQIKLPAMTSEEFGRLYITFVTAWNREEH